MYLTICVYRGEQSDLSFFFFSFVLKFCYMDVLKKKKSYHFFSPNTTVEINKGTISLPSEIKLASYPPITSIYSKLHAM